MIHSLYNNGTGRYARNMFRTNYGQSNLAQITDGTGGESFFQGLQTPISYAPYLQQLDTILMNQDFLTFTTTPSKNGKGELRNIRVRMRRKGSGYFRRPIASGCRSHREICNWASAALYRSCCGGPSCF